MGGGNSSGSGGGGGDSDSSGSSLGMGHIGNIGGIVGSYGGGTGSMGAADNSAPGVSGEKALAQSKMAAGGTNDLGYTAKAYDAALSRVPASTRDASGPLGLGATTTPGGLFSGGLLNGWSPALTALGYAVPPAAPAMMALTMGNMALGATNSLGITDTGAIDSPSTVGYSALNAVGLAPAADYASMMAARDKNPYSGTSAGDSTEKTGTASAEQGNTAQPGSQLAGNTGGSGAPSLLASNQPVTDPGLLAEVTKLPAKVFVSPYAPQNPRKTPELDQGLLQSRLWGLGRA